MIEIEIYWQDLTEEKRKEIAETIDMVGSDHNWTVFPVATVCVKDDNEY